MPADQAPVPVGHEDEFDNEAGALPRYKMVGEVESLGGQPGFVNETAGIAVPSLDVIVLGAVKGRVLWPPEMSDGGNSIPYCKSLDGLVGLPDMGEPDSEPPRAGYFPWKAVPPEFKALLTPENTVPCGECPLKEWGSHPTQDKPWCAEQSTWVVKFGDGEADDGALLTFQRSSLKPAQNYIMGFRSPKPGLPMFVVRTKITLTQQTRGTVVFAIPTFKRGEATVEANHNEWASQYIQVRNYLHTQREPREETSTTAVVTSKPGDVPVAGFQDDGNLPF